MLAVGHLLTCTDVIISIAAFLLQKAFQMQRIVWVFRDRS